MRKITKDRKKLTKCLEEMLSIMHHKFICPVLLWFTIQPIQLFFFIPNIHCIAYLINQRLSTPPMYPHRLF